MVSSGMRVRRSLSSITPLCGNHFLRKILWIRWVERTKARPAQVSPVTNAVAEASLFLGRDRQMLGRGRRLIAEGKGWEIYPPEGARQLKACESNMRFSNYLDFSR